MAAGLDKDTLLNRITDGILRSQFFDKIFQFDSGWQMQVPKEVDDFFKTGIVVHQFGDIVACISQIIIDNRADAGIAGNQIFQSTFFCHIKLLLTFYARP